MDGAADRADRLEAVSPEPRHSIGWPILVQRWAELAFLHWPVAPEVVAPFLPAGTRPDTLDGLSYVGLIAFRMVGLGPFPGPGLPYLGTFCETNVRLYSVDGTGRRAVVFLSLDAARLLPVLIAQATLRLPYKWSSMRLVREGDLRTYTSRRRWPGQGGARAGGRQPGQADAGRTLNRHRPDSHLVIRIGAPISEPTPLEHFVTARWGLHVRAYGRTLHLPNHHPRWPLHRASLLELDDRLVVRSGLPQPAGAPVSVLYSPGVPVRFGRPVTLPR